MKDWYKKKVIAVTGACGFLGSHLCEALVEAGAEVLALDNFEVCSAESLAAIQNRIQVVEYDITRPNPDNVLSQAEVVFHLAAIANPRACQEDFDKAYKVNVQGTKNVLEACRSEARFVFLSGAMVYGDPLTDPIPETHPLGARDPYALSKIMGESLTWAVAPTRNLRATVVRNFSTYGPRQSPNYVIPRIVEQALGKGRIELWTTTPTRDFTYVSDTIQALLCIAASDALIGKAVNLGSGKETSIGEVARTVADLVGGLSLHDQKKDVGGSQRQRADNSKLRQATSWEPRMKLAEGLALTLDWWKKARNEPALV